MAILLDHVIVPSRSPVASAQVFAEILGVAWEAKVAHMTSTLRPVSRSSRRLDWSRFR